MFEMQDMRLKIIAHPRSELWSWAGCLTTGPIPWALTMHHTKNAIPAMGTTTAFSVNKCRLFERVSVTRQSISRKGVHLVDREPYCG